MVERKDFPLSAEDYDLLEDIGHGAFAVVYRATCRPLDQVVAIKIMDLDKQTFNLVSVSTETQVMSLVDHPNVIKSYCSFSVSHFLWVVMPYMDGGSCLHIMKISYPDGLEESAIAIILNETLKGLHYLHQQQQMHRDIKAGNILIDAHGAVKLGDFGTLAYLFSAGDRQRSRSTFTGTPCWMAPEVMEQKYGYDCRADIWSFGITALELAHGHAPFSKYPPMKVLLMTINNAAPYLDREKDKHFSKAFKDVVKLCLNKDPSKRPTTEKLLKHPFFKHTKYNSSIVKKLLSGLGPLWEREKILKEKDAALLALKQPAFLQEEAKSRDEYKRGVSSWNFDVESLKDQAALMQDEDELSSTTADGDTVSEVCPERDGEYFSRNTSQVLSPSAKNMRQPLTLNTNQLGRKSWLSEKEPRQYGRFGVFDGDVELESPGWHEIVRPSKDDDNAFKKLPTIAEDKGRDGCNEKGPEDFDASTNLSSMNALPEQKSLERDRAYDESLPLPMEKGVSTATTQNFEERQLFLRKSCSAMASRDTGLLQTHLQSVFDASISPASLLGPQLKRLLFQTIKQYETLFELLKIASPDEAANMPFHIVHNEGSTEGEFVTMDCSSALNSQFEHQIHGLQSKITSLTTELVSVKHRNVQLERQLNAMYNRQEEERIQREEAEE